MVTRVADIRFILFQDSIGFILRNGNILSFLKNTGMIAVFADFIVLAPVGNAGYSADKGNQVPGSYQFIQGFFFPSAVPGDGLGTVDQAIIICIDCQVHIQKTGCDRQCDEMISIEDFCAVRAQLI